MAKYRRYSGSFAAADGNMVSVEIWQEADTDFASGGSLTFPYDTPVEIEWSRHAFEEPVWGSTATVKVISEGDRQFIDLYTETPGSIRCDIYRSGVLYWSGCLDCEFYEEPYESAAGYEVTLTFTDFGVLDRLKYDLDGIQSVAAILDYCLEKAQINYRALQKNTVFFLATTFSDGENLFTDTGLAVRSENFTDEDGNASTLREVLEAVLQPLGICIVQRAGGVSLFDLTGLRSGTSYNGQLSYQINREIAWSSDSQTLGVDSVYNGIEIDFSQYADTQIYDGDYGYPGAYDTDHYNLTSDLSDAMEAYHRYTSYWPDYNYTGDNATDTNKYEIPYDIDFTIFLTGGWYGDCRGDADQWPNGDPDLTFPNDNYGHPSGAFCHILPMYGGAEETDAVAYLFTTGGHGALSSLTSGTRCIHGTGVYAEDESRLYTTRRIYLPPGSSANWIRVKVEALIDCRYNPFTEASKYNESGNQSTLESNSAYVFVPLFVSLWDSEEDGECLFHYDNSYYAEYKGNGHDHSRGFVYGSWKSGEPAYGDAWLEYYDPTDLSSGSGGVGAWKANHQTIGRRNSSVVLTQQLKGIDDGEYIPYKGGGWLEVSIGGHPIGFGPKDVDTDLTGEACTWNSKGIYNQTNSSNQYTSYGTLRWVMYKAPVIDLVAPSLSADDLSVDDIVYRGKLDADAADDLSINTVCGTGDDALPTAKGLYYRLDDMTKAVEIARGSLTGHPEKLLIGQLYAQYGGRKTTLSGEAEILPGLVRLTDAAQEDGKVFCLMSDVEDLRAGTAEIEVCELGTDVYVPADE